MNKPTAKIIQITSLSPTLGLVVLCDDGSVWALTIDGKFRLIAEMNGKTY